MSRVRRATEADAEECVAIGLAALGPTYRTAAETYGGDLGERMISGWDTTISDLLRARCSPGEHHTLVAETAAGLRGVISVSPAPDTGLGTITVIAVEPSLHRRGIGSDLLETGLAELRKAGMAYAFVGIRDHPGHVPIRGLLETHGFSAQGIQPHTLVTALPRNAAPAHTVRPIDDGDIDECMRFGLESFRPVFRSFENAYGEDLFHRMRPDWENAQTAYMRMACTEKRTLVAEIDGAPVGFVVIVPDQFPGVGAIELLAVSPDHDNAGVGTELNLAALEELSTAGMKYAVVSTGTDPGHAPARRSYKKAGFHPAPVQWHLMDVKL